MNTQQYRIGVIGTGFIGRGFVMAIERQQDLSVSKVLTRTQTANRPDFPRQDLLTNSIDELISNTDIVLECSGEVVYSTTSIAKIMSAGIPVVTMNSELQVTTGSYFAGRGLITEAEGDQPGCIAALAEDARHMGFRPLVYGNIKGFLNLNPTEDEMHFWAKKQNISFDKVIQFTDGTKVQIEQALVANGLGGSIAQPGLLGLKSDDLNTVGKELAAYAKKLGYAISDYVLSAKLPPGVFIVAEHDERQKMYLTNFKLGDGPYYVLLRNYHLCHLEIAKTLRRVLAGGRELLNNGRRPSISVAAIAKKPLKPGYTIRRGIGSFDVRGTALRITDYPHHVPIGLLENAVVTRTIKPDDIVEFDHVELPDSLALHAWKTIVQTVMHPPLEGEN